MGVKGIQYVARASLYLNLIPFLMILIVFFKTADGIAAFTVPEPAPALAFATVIAIVIGFFATAGAAGTDFGMNSRNAKDVKWGGLIGIALPVLYAGGLPLLSVAGAKGLHPTLASLDYGAVIGSIGGWLSSATFFLFALASIAPACFCAFIAGNSFSTMIPGVPRMSSTMTGVTVSVILAITGVAANLVPFFQIVGASFGPICGAMAADYLLSGRKWAGPRRGINWAGYSAWALGFMVGIIPFLPVPAAIKDYSQPAVVYSFVVGFLVYALLAKLGAEPETVEVREPNPVGAPTKRARAQASPE
jgi:cytosine permease